MTTRTITLWTLIAALTLTAGLAAAQPRGGRGPGCDGDGPGRDGAFGPRMAALLDLSEEQAAAIDALREAHRAATTDQRKTLMRLRNELHGLMLADDVDAQKVLGLTRKVGDLRTELRVARAEMRLKVRELLTDEQRDRMMLHKGRRGARGGRGACDGGGRFPGRDDDGRGRGPRGGGRRI